MGVFEELIENKEDLIVKIMKILEGREATTKLNLDNIKFNVGESSVKVNGSLEISVAPFSKKK